MTDTPSGTFVEPLQLDHLEAQIPEGLLELYEVLEYVDHPSVSGTFPQPMMASQLFAMSLPSGFISRQQWGARPPRSVSRIPLPRGNTGHWEGPAQGLYDHSSCATKVRGIQAFHMSKGWADIAYSTVVCRHGFIYDCRGYNVRTAANGTEMGNDRSYAHCVLIGEGDTFPIEAKRGLRSVWQWYESRGSGGARWDHNDWKPTACPGTDVERFIKVDNLLVPELPPPAPDGPFQLLDTVEIDMVLNTYSVSIGTTPSGQAWAGSGWVRVPFSRSQIKGFTPGGIRPAVDHKYETAQFGFAADDKVDDPGTVLTVEGWAPGEAVVVEFTVAE